MMESTTHHPPTMSTTYTPPARHRSFGELRDIANMGRIRRTVSPAEAEALMRCCDAFGPETAEVLLYPVHGDGYLYIERLTDGQYALQIANLAEVSTNLRELEAQLYDWAMDEDYCFEIAY